MRMRTTKGQPRTPLSASPDHTVPGFHHYGTISPAPPTRTVPVVPHPHAPRHPDKLASPEPWKLPSLQLWSSFKPSGLARLFGGPTRLGPA